MGVGVGWRMYGAAMSYAALKVVRWVSYGEYVAAWEPIPITERPSVRVISVDGDWFAVPRGPSDISRCERASAAAP